MDRKTRIGITPRAGSASTGAIDRSSLRFRCLTMLIPFPERNFARPSCVLGSHDTYAGWLPYGRDKGPFPTFFRRWFTKSQNPAETMRVCVRMDHKLRWQLL